MKKAVLILFGIGLIIGFVAFVNQPKSAIVKNYFDSYNAKDTSKLNSLLDPNFHIKSPFADITRTQFITAFNNIKQLNESLLFDHLDEKNNIVNTTVTQSNDYLNFLAVGPQKTSYQFSFVGDKIKDIRVDTLPGQNASNKLIRQNSEAFMTWLSEKYPDTDSLDLTAYMQRLKEFYEDNQSKAKK